MIFEIPKDTEVLQIDITELKKQIRADAIDEFVTIIKERVGMDWEWDFYFIGQIAEELKEQK